MYYIGGRLHPKQLHCLEAAIVALLPLCKAFKVAPGLHRIADSFLRLSSLFFASQLKAFQHR